MKMIKTLTPEQITSLINGETVGIFIDMITSDDIYSSIKYELCLGYYLERSGDKPISLPYQRLINLNIAEPASVIGKICRNKFKEKWSKQYLALISEQYNPLIEFEKQEDINRDNTDTTTYNTQIHSTGSRANKSTTSYNDEEANDVYGFNSVSPVGSDTSATNYTETVTGLAEDNTTDSNENKTGSDTKNYKDKENKVATGRNNSAAELLDKELDMRNRQIFFDIVYYDIDSIATSGVYDIDNIYDECCYNLPIYDGGGYIIR